MLGKLIKYDFKSTSRIMWLLYLGLIVVAALLGLTVRFITPNERGVTFSFWGVEMDGANKMISILLTTFGMVFVLLLQAVAIMTVVMIVLRFNKNLLGGEGYLMHTLPVKTSELIGSKLIISMIWMFIAVLAGLLSGLTFAATSGWLEWLIRETTWDDFVEFIESVFSVNGLLITIFAVISSIAFITKCYVSMAIGNLANKNKFLFAVLAYIGIGIATSIITSIIAVPGGRILRWLFASEAMSKGLVVGIVAELVLSVIYFFATDWILKKKLNLA